MQLAAYLRNFSIAPIQLTFLEKCITALACLIAVFLTASITQRYTEGQSAVLIASMGASAIILFATPGSPLAQPWPFVGGHLFSALIGVCAAHYVPDIVLAATLAIGFSVMLMLLLRCLHPPGAATALAPVLHAIHSSTPDLKFLFAPVGVNVLVMMLSALLINRLILKRDYPAKTQAGGLVNQQTQQPDNLLGISQADIKQAPREFHEFLDISAEDLCQILTRLQLLALEKNIGQISCGDIMQRNIISVEYATEVEAAWLLMHEHRLKVLPVLDQTHRVIGIVTRYDFLKNLKLTPYQNFQDQWLTFIKRSPDTTTNKPEAIGHIMTRKVKTLPASAHIGELLPLVVNEGHHHVPIVDDSGHFVGMVFQSQLLATLFKQQAASFESKSLAGCRK